MYQKVTFNKQWTYSSVKLLLESYKTMGLRYVAARLKKHLRAVERKCNRMGISKMNKSDHPSIFWDPNKDMWHVYIIEKYSILDFGYFETEKDAYDAIYKWKIIREDMGIM